MSRFALVCALSALREPAWLSCGALLSTGTLAPAKSYKTTSTTGLSAPGYGYRGFDLSLARRPLVFGSLVDCTHCAFSVLRVPALLPHEMPPHSALLYWSYDVWQWRELRDDSSSVHLSRAFGRSASHIVHWFSWGGGHGPFEGPVSPGEDPGGIPRPGKYDIVEHARAVTAVLLGSLRTCRLRCVMV